MERSILKKLIALALTAALMTVPLSSCGNSNGEYGGIGDADISQDEPAESSAETPFTKTDNPFEEYTYKTVDFESACMTFDAPKTWKQTIINHTCIRYDVPGDDQNLPGAVFYLKCDLDSSALESDQDPFNHVASEFAKRMSIYITGLPFPYNEGRNVWINSYSASDDEQTPPFTEDKTAASLKVTNDVVLIDKTTADTYSIEGFDLVAGYFRWNDVPAMLMTVVPTDWVLTAQDMINYMISSAVYKEPKLSPLATYEYRKLSLELPSEFQQAAANKGNVFLTSSMDIKADSSMAVGVFSVSEPVKDLSAEYVQGTYIDGVISLLLDPDYSKHYYPAASCTDYEGEPLADEKAAFRGYVNLPTNLYDYTSAENPYGNPGIRCVDMFIVERGGNNYMIAIMYEAPQEKTAMKIAKAAIQSLKLK